MAGRAFGGNLGVGALQGIKDIVIKNSRLPGVFAVAAFAGSREACRSVVRIVRAVVIRLVTAHAGIWRVAVIAVRMAGRAFGSDLSVGALQDVIVIVNIKSSRRPSRISRMTRGTILRKIQTCMLRINRSLIILLMAIKTIRGSSGIALTMTLLTVQANMSTGKREICQTVIKIIQSRARWMASITGIVRIHIT